ncbi:MAG: L-lactate dehydrogenase, partial [Bacilli bacterium]|nr:L-lactate dehydrogenase [Bacilli bacterium]
MKRKELNLRKVVVIGDGMVGSSIAYTLLLQSAATNVVLIDVNIDKTIGDALDMNHAVSLSSPKEIKAGDYSDIIDAHIIIITAGANQKPGETRIDLLNKNKAILRS